MSEKHECCRGDEITLLSDPGPTGRRIYARHCADHKVIVGECWPCKEGQPLNGTPVVALKRKGDGVYDVVGEYGADPNHCSGEAGGPALVASDAYRDGWDRIFGARPVGQA